MSDKVFKESGAIQVLSIQMSKQGVNEFTLANNEILLAVFCQGRGDVTFSDGGFGGLSGTPASCGGSD